MLYSCRVWKAELSLKDKEAFLSDWESPGLILFDLYSFMYFGESGADQW